MTFDAAVGRIFSYNNRKFYVVRARHLWKVIVIDLETSTEIFIYNNLIVDSIPPEWKEILP